MNFLIIFYERKKKMFLPAHFKWKISWNSSQDGNENFFRDGSKHRFYNNGNVKHLKILSITEFQWLNIYLHLEYFSLLKLKFQTKPGRFLEKKSFCCQNIEIIFRKRGFWISIFVSVSCSAKTLGNIFSKLFLCWCYFFAIILMGNIFIWMISIWVILIITQPVFALVEPT